MVAEPDGWIGRQAIDLAPLGQEHLSTREGLMVRRQLAHRRAGGALEATLCCITPPPAKLVAGFP